MPPLHIHSQAVRFLALASLAIRGLKTVATPDAWHWLVVGLTGRLIVADCFLCLRKPHALKGG